MKMKYVPSLLLLLVVVFVNSCLARLNPSDEIEYKGRRAKPGVFWNDEDFRNNVYLYTATKKDGSGVFSYVKFISLKEAQLMDRADEISRKKHEKNVSDLAEKMNVADEENHDFSNLFYCSGDGKKEPALYYQMKDMDISCDEFYKLVQQSK